MNLLKGAPLLLSLAFGRRGYLPVAIIRLQWPGGVTGSGPISADFFIFLKPEKNRKTTLSHITPHHPTSPHFTPHHPTPPRITPHYPTAPKTSPKHHPTPKNHPKNIQKHHPKHRLKQSWFSQPVDFARMQYQGEWVSFVEEKVLVIENNPKAGVPCPTLGVLGG